MMFKKRGGVKSLLNNVKKKLHFSLMMASLINVSSRKPQKYFKPFPHQGNKQT